MGPGAGRCHGTGHRTPGPGAQDSKSRGAGAAWLLQLALTQPPGNLGPRWAAVGTGCSSC